MALPPLADPTNFGNAPGAGPLRPGGQPAKEVPQKEDNLPSTRSKASARQQPSVQLVRALWGGNEALHDAEHAKQFLPPNPGEHAEDYKVRLNRAVFHNFYRRTVEGLTGLIYRVDPVLNDDVPAQTVEHWENIDGEGTHGDVFVREQTQEAIHAGHGAILVEYPQTDGDQTLKDEQGEIRPYWVPIKKEDLISWRTEKTGGKVVLTQLVVRERAMVPFGDYGEREQVRYRVFRREDTGRVTWELLEVHDNRTVVEIAEGDYPTQTEIPVVEIPSSGSDGLFESVPPLLDFAYMNRAHYNQWSDQDTSIHKTCSPFLFFAGADPIAEGQPAPQVVIGPNTMVRASNPQASLNYTSHNGAALGSVKAAIDELKADMGTVGLAMLAPQKRTAETAEAKRLDKATSDSALAVTARAVQDAVEKCLYFHARYLKGQPDGGSITINRDFEGLVMESPVMSAYAQLVGAGMPPRIVLEMLKAGGRIPDDADLDALELEWQAGAAAAEAAKVDALRGFGGGIPQDDTAPALSVERGPDGKIMRLVRG